MRTPSYDDIVGQADSLRTTIDAMMATAPEVLQSRRSWLFTGSGASFHAATTAAATIAAVGDVTATAAPAAEVWMNPDMWVRPGAVVVALSRTGTTTETVQAMRTATRVSGTTTVGFSLTPDTEVVKEAEIGLCLEWVAERGRVMTRSFSNLLLASQMLALQAAVPAKHLSRSAVSALPERVTSAIDSYDALAQKLAQRPTDHVVFLGSGSRIGLCRQAALQLQETSGLPVEAHSVLDYRHGPIASLGAATTVVILTSPRSQPADLIVADDVATLGGAAVVVGAQEALGAFETTTEVVPVPGEGGSWLSGNVALPFLQLFAYYLTVQRDADPESVHNLDRAKSPHINPHVLPDSLFDADLASVDG